MDKGSASDCHSEMNSHSEMDKDKDNEQVAFVAKRTSALDIAVAMALVAEASENFLS